MRNSDEFDSGPTLIGLRSGAPIFGGRYTLERELGRGGTGIVWLANDTSLDMPIALKFLPPEVASDDLALADLKRETKRCLVLTHPHIVRVYGWHEENGLAAISMEYIDGASLSKLRLQRDHWIFTPEEVRPWMKAACEALEYAHTEAKVVHRDIKPGNLMVNSAGVLKVCDFGIARSLGESRSRLTGGRVGESAGTPPYMSPQHRMGLRPSPADDVYGLGATLYELLTGKPPFYTGDISYQIETVVPPPMEERRGELGITDAAPIPPRWEAVVASCLEKDPIKRPQSMAQVWKRLEEPVIGAAVTPESQPQTQPAPKPAATCGDQAGDPAPRRLRPWRKAALAALVLFGLVTGAVIWQRQTVGTEDGGKAKIKAEEEKARVELEAARRAKEESDRKTREAETARLAAEEKAKLETAEAKRAKEEAAREAAKLAAREKAKAEQARAGAKMDVDIAPGVKMTFRWCPPGSFLMGSPAGEKAVIKAAGVEEWIYRDETPHQVTFRNGFWLAETEVTHGQWKAVMGSNLVEQARKALQDNTIYRLDGKKQTQRDYWGQTLATDPRSMLGSESDQVAMYYVNWQEAVDFCQKAGNRVAPGKAGFEMRLPTEAEWEYACRAGTKGMTYAGDFAIKGLNNAPGLDGIAWYGGNSSNGYEGRGWEVRWNREKQHPGVYAGPRRVGMKQANAWGLRDMLGNLGEWCADWYGTYPTGAVVEPTGPAKGDNRVSRGGSWGIIAANCRAAYRRSTAPGSRSHFLGFRPALIPSLVLSGSGN
jgi:formylglycine-generating enzyme required for sulfatase activity